MNLGGGEILVILIVAVLVLGPDKLPSALRMFGKTMAEVRKYQNLAKNEIEKAMNMDEHESQTSSSSSRSQSAITQRRDIPEEDEIDGPKPPIIDDES